MRWPIGSPSSIAVRSWANSAAIPSAPWSLFSSCKQWLARERRPRRSRSRGGNSSMATLAEPTQTSEQTSPAPVRRSSVGPLRWVRRHREFASALGFMLLMFVVFAIASPGVFLKPTIYNAIFVSVPISMILAVSLVFVIVSGEIDLSFPSLVGVTAMVFTIVVTAGGNPWLALVLALMTGVVCGLI